MPAIWPLITLYKVYPLTSVLLSSIPIWFPADCIVEIYLIKKFMERVGSKLPINTYSEG